MKNRLLEFPSEIDVRSSVAKDFTDMEMKQTWKPTKCKSAKTQHEHLKFTSQYWNILENQYP